MLTRAAHSLIQDVTWSRDAN